MIASTQIVALDGSNDADGAIDNIDLNLDVDSFFVSNLLDHTRGCQLSVSSAAVAASSQLSADYTILGCLL